jgi:hypothetical protein
MSGFSNKITFQIATRLFNFIHAKPKPKIDLSLLKKRGDFDVYKM